MYMSMQNMCIIITRVRHTKKATEIEYM